MKDSIASLLLDDLFFEVAEVRGVVLPQGGRRDPVDWTKRISKKFPSGVTEYSAAAAAQQDDNPNSDNRVAKGKGVKGPAFEISPKLDDELPDGFTAKEAVQRLHDLKSQDKPFFLAVGFLKPHLPFVAPKKYWDLYDPDQIPLPATERLPKDAPDFVGHTNGELHNYVGVPKENPIPADFAKTLRHGYYACISDTDAQVGRLLDALDKEGLADNTVVVLWGDHGWQLGDHGLWHKHTNFELAARAPLILSVPQQKSAGQKCDAPVEFVDVYPTLADVCGLPIPAGLDGASLKPFVENPAAPTSKVAISQYPRNAGKAGGAVMGYSIRDARWRGTFWRERNGSKIVATELYDEQNDPAETINLADKPEHQAVIESLRQHVPPDGSADSDDKAKKPKAAESKPKKAKTADTTDRAAQNVSTVSAVVRRDSPVATKPNIIFILADDFGIGNVGCYGADNDKTPHIDKLASTGTRFTHCYTAALCGPSRAMILSGRSAFRTGATNQDACGRMASSELYLARPRAMRFKRAACRKAAGFLRRSRTRSLTACGSPRPHS